MHFRGLCPGPTRGGFKRYIVPGPRWARKSSGAHVRFWCRTQWRMHGIKFQQRPFFWSSPNFGQKIGLNISEDFFFFWSSVWCPKRFGGPVSTFVPPGEISLWGPACASSAWVKICSWTRKKQANAKTEPKILRQRPFTFFVFRLHPWICGQEAKSAPLDSAPTGASPLPPGKTCAPKEGKRPG